MPDQNTPGAIRHVDGEDRRQLRHAHGDPSAAVIEIPAGDGVINESRPL